MHFIYLQLSDMKIDMFYITFLKRPRFRLNDQFYALFYLRSIISIVHCATCAWFCWRRSHIVERKTPLYGRDRILGYQIPSQHGAKINIRLPARSSTTSGKQDIFYFFLIKFKWNSALYNEKTVLRGRDPTKRMDWASGRDYCVQI